MSFALGMISGALATLTFLVGVFAFSQHDMLKRLKALEDSQSDDDDDNGPEGDEEDIPTSEAQPAPPVRSPVIDIAAHRDGESSDAWRDRCC